jgi:hypothetical protein
MTCTLFREKLIKNGYIYSKEVSYSTLYRFLKKHKLLHSNLPDPKPRMRFAYKKVNVLWQGDLMYSVYLKDGKRKRQTYLIAFIDDATRVITGAQFSFSQKFNEWLEVDYHRKKHLGLDRKPLDVFMEQIDTVKMCTDPEIIESAFHVRVKRKVHNTDTISLNNNIYEVPGEYIGAHVEVRYTPEDLNVVYIYLDELLIHTASKVDFEANAKSKRTSFSNFSEN